MLLILMHVQNLVKIHLLILKILNGNEILTSFKGRYFVMNWRKWTLNNPKLDVVDINAYKKGQNPFFHLQDIDLFVCVGVLRPSQQRGHVEPVS